MPASQHPFSRRGFLAGAGLAATCWALPGRAQAPALTPDGFRILRVRTGTAALRGEKEPRTPIWGFEGTAPGPTLRVKRGEDVRVRVANELPAPLAVHWHGVRLPNAMDGAAPLTQPPIATGASFDCRFRPPDAGTFWYRADVAATSGAAHSLSGILLVDEIEPIGVDRDVVLAFESWQPASEGAGAAHLTVNGAPHVDVPVRANERLRLRLVNATRMRALALRIDGLPVRVMAVDGQPAEPFLARDSRVTLGPGNRADLFVDVALAPGASAAITVANAAEATPIARLICGPEAARPAPLPEPKPLPANPLPQRLDLRGALRHELALDTLAPLASSWHEPWHEPWHERPPLFRVKRGRAVVLAARNPTEGACALHLHGHSARLLDRLDDGWKPFWIDTLVAAPRQTERIAFLADNPGRWALDGRFLGRGSAMAAWFEVM